MPIGPRQVGVCYSTNARKRSGPFFGVRYIFVSLFILEIATEKTLIFNSNPSPSWKHTQSTVLDNHPENSFSLRVLAIGLFILIENNGAYPFYDVIMAYPGELLHIFIPWVGKKILHLSYDITRVHQRQRWHYLRLCGSSLWSCSLSVTGTMVWSLPDRDRKITPGFITGSRLPCGFMSANALQLRHVQSHRCSSPSRVLVASCSRTATHHRWVWPGRSSVFRKAITCLWVLQRLLPWCCCSGRTVTVGAIITLQDHRQRNGSKLFLWCTCENCFHLACGDDVVPAVTRYETPVQILPLYRWGDQLTCDASPGHPEEMVTWITRAIH